MTDDAQNQPAAGVPTDAGRDAGPAAGTDGAVHDEPSLRDQVLDQMGGWQGMVYSALPVIAFVPANALWGVGWASVAAIGAALLVFVVRIATKSSLQPAISGLFGVAVCVVIALILGGRWYFLYGIVSQAVLALAFLVSILVRRPLVGVLWHFLDDKANDRADGTGDWRADRRRFRGFVWLTVLWTVVFVARFLVQGQQFLDDNVGALGASRIVMGWPLFAALLLVTFWYGRKLTHARHG